MWSSSGALARRLAMSVEREVSTAFLDLPRTFSDTHVAAGGLRVSARVRILPDMRHHLISQTRTCRELQLWRGLREYRARRS